mgnify:FL=1
MAHLFFYGVLREGVGDWPFLEGLGLGSPATTTGALFAIPAGPHWYPALIPTQARYSSIVHGTIHEAGSVDFAAIDAFEGADYTRMAIDVDGWDGFGDTRAEAYIWTADLPTSALPIPHGDFVQRQEEPGNTPHSEVSDR